MAAGFAIPTFEEDTKVESYLERLDCYFDVADTTTGKKVNILLIGYNIKLCRIYFHWICLKLWPLPGYKRLITMVNLGIRVCK